MNGKFPQTTKKYISTTTTVPATKKSVFFYISINIIKFYVMFIVLLCIFCPFLALPKYPILSKVCNNTLTSSLAFSKALYWEIFVDIFYFFHPSPIKCFYSNSVSEDTYQFDQIKELYSASQQQQQPKKRIHLNNSTILTARTLRNFKSNGKVLALAKVH